MGLDFKAPCKFTLSANEIRVFSECSRKRYYSSRDCLAIRSNTPRKALILGTVFHAALQHYYTTINNVIKDKFISNNLEFTYDDICDIYDTIEKFPLTKEKVNEETGEVEVDENGEPVMVPIVADGDYKTLVNMISCYLPTLFNDLLEFDVIACESNFNLENWPLRDVMYHGLIDMIVRRRSDNKVYYFEHKTCTNFRPEIYSRFDIQLHLYSIEGHRTYGEDFGGILLNQVKKAKTEKGYDQQRDLYAYSIEELNDFEQWLLAKTEQLVSPSNNHAPCNNYMTCKMCEYIDICMRYGYEVPKTHEEITENIEFTDDDDKPLYMYDPRDSKDDSEGGE